MTITHNGDHEETSDGRRFIAYGRKDNGAKVAVWFHDGLYSYDEPAWGMRGKDEWRIDSEVAEIIALYEGHAYSIDRDAFTSVVRSIDGIDQFIATASDEWVQSLGRAHNVCDDYLSGNHRGDYHQRANH